MVTAPVPEFDAVVAEAVRAISAPVAFVGFIDPSGEVVKAARGWNVAVIPPAVSFAIRIANQPDVVVVPDTLQDPRFVSHPLVTGAPNIRFYAGVPLFSDGSFVGALSVIDRAPRTLTPEQVSILRLLGRQISRELEVRREKEELNERFREFFEQTDDFVMSIGPDLRLVHSNEAVLNVLGYTREEISAQPLLRVVEPSSRDDFKSTVTQVFESGEAQPVETVFITAGGRRITVEGTLRPRVIQGRTMMVRVIFRDITERKEFEAELGNARDAALEAARLKTQFLTNVSHEIRTPMNGIIGMLDLLLSTNQNEEQRDFAMQAHASADQLLSMVNNILHVSTVEAGGLGTSNVDFDLYRTLQRIVEVMKVAALGKDVDVKLVYDESLPPIFRGNQSKLRQIVTNLMENAIKFTEQGSIRLRVMQQTETETHRVIRFEVQDTGIGISEEDRLLLFEKFSQIDGSQSRKFQGAGLGLATARQLVETMGGLIDVDSKVGQGSTFWFSIPFPKQDSARKPIASSELEFKGKRVLLVDHAPTSRKIVQHYLSSTWEMRVDLADSAMAALTVLRNEADKDSYRVVLFDNMPDLDAMSFAREVRADARISDTSLVYLAPTGAEVNREHLREAGVNAYVTKPVGQGELFDAMTVALAREALPLSRSLGATPEARQPVADVDSKDRKRVKLLLAEDNFLNMKLTMSQIHRLGYVADSVANGKEAVEAVENGDYGIVLMDCQMPVLDGYQATIEIRRREREKGLKPRRIIALTANALEGDREKCLAAGMDDYLSKPTKHDELEIALARYFESATGARR